MLPIHSQPANPSVKGTSCGKPQATPYVERWASRASSYRQVALKAESV
jgi:hypothetical protein